MSRLATRRLLLVGVLSQVSQGSVSQAVAGVAVALCFLVLHMTARPFHRDSDDYLGAAAPSLHVHALGAPRLAHTVAPQGTPHTHPADPTAPVCPPGTATHFSLVMILFSVVVLKAGVLAQAAHLRTVTARHRHLLHGC